MERFWLYTLHSRKISIKLPHRAFPCALAFKILAGFCLQPVFCPSSGLLNSKQELTGFLLGVYDMGLASF